MATMYDPKNHELYACYAIFVGNMQAHFSTLIMFYANVNGCCYQMIRET